MDFICMPRTQIMQKNSRQKRRMTEIMLAKERKNKGEDDHDDDDDDVCDEEWVQVWE